MRKLILISNPGTDVEGNRQPTTETVIDRFENFFRSNIGGKWEDNEIERFGDNHPLSVQNMENMMEELDNVDCAYSLIVFCGHGGAADNGEEGIQLPRTDTRNLNTIRISRLLSLDEDDEVRRRLKRTVILDACREILPITPQQLFEGDMNRQIPLMNGVQCRDFYNDIIARNMPHVELLQSTSSGTPAFPTRSGSEYSDQIFKIVNHESITWRRMALMNANGKFAYSMRNLHDNVTTNIALTTRRQLPQFSIIGDGSVGFPFATFWSNLI